MVGNRLNGLCVAAWLSLAVGCLRAQDIPSPTNLAAREEQIIAADMAAAGHDVRHTLELPLGKTGRRTVKLLRWQPRKAVWSSRRTATL